MSNYHPRPLAIRVMYISVDYGPGKWRRISRRLKVVKLQALTILPDIAHIADVLNAHLYTSKRQ